MSIELSPSEIGTLTGSKALINSPEKTVNRYSVDSRSVAEPAKTLFFALETTTNNGHRFIEALYYKGGRNFVVRAVPKNLPEANFYLTDNVENALKNLAINASQQIGGNKVAITGSRGKTVVKEWLAKTLPVKATRSPRSYNSQIGVPLSILELDPNAPVALIEAGISQKGEMEILEKIISPKTGILTDITDEHNDGFLSRAEKIREKLKLFNNVEKLIVCPAKEDVELISILNETIGAERIIFAEELPLQLKDFPGEPYKKRMMRLAIEACRQLGYDPNLNAEVFAGIATRIDVIAGINNCIVLHDRFTNDRRSLELALDFARRRMSENRKLTLIASTGKEMSEKEIEETAELYGVKKVYAVENAKVFTEQFDTNSFKDEVILIKDEPESMFDKIVSMLEEKQHETVLEVNLDNLIHNFNFFRSRLPKSTDLTVMLKANGYGCGSLELARTLQSQGASAIAVAVIDEGIDLRKAGITMPIIVLNPRSHNYSLMFSNRLEPEIYNIDILKHIILKAEEAGVADFPIHIKLDTGMHRLGFSKEELPELIDVLTKTNRVRVESVFSHLATADCRELDEYTQLQFERFDDSVTYLRERLPYSFKAHILNTAGILRFPEHSYQMARLGIGLYGLPVLNDGSENSLRPVAALRSTIIALSKRKAGDTIGYSCRGKVEHEAMIATIPIGYADGIDRRMGNGKAYFMVNGHKCPTIGNICMDICMIDVTGVDCRVGDRVEIFGTEIDICEIARTLETIPYEILTSTSERVKRIYFRE